MTLTFEIAGAQIDGAREYQEDAFLITHLVDKQGQASSLMIVADGMGGHAAGNIAGNMAVQNCSKHITANYPADNISQVLHDAILKANHSIAETIKETPALDGMGCTLVGVLLEGNKLWWASVGDSNLYLLRNRELNKINADHSYGGFLDSMATAGTPVEPEPGLSRNMLMSALTGGDISDIDCPSSPMQVQAGDKILICSDGINTLSNGKIIQYCDWSESPKECVEALLTAVEDAELPKQDNTTTIVVYVVDKTAAPAASPKVEEKDMEDITDPKHKAPATAAPSEIERNVAAEIEIKAPPEPLTRPDRPRVETTATVSADKYRKFAIISIAAGIIIAAGIGAYFMRGSGKISTHTTVATKPAEQAQPPVTETEVAPPESVTTPVETPKAQEPAKIAEPETIPAPAEKPVAVTEPKTETAGAKEKEFQDALKEGDKGPIMVWIPAGTYEMGSPGSSSNKDERPKHTVKFKKFAISKYEITIAQYEIFAKATKRQMPDDLYMEHDTSPVVLVKWDDAYNFTKWLSEQTGHKYRLPSEAEWEYAASGGKDSTFWWGFNEEPGKAHCFNCGSQFDPRKPAKIGKFQPNQFGLYDTAGNLSEWVYDCWHDSYAGAPNDGTVWEGGDCIYRIARGGSYISPQQSIRTAKRDKFKSDAGYDHIGIRLARDE